MRSNIRGWAAGCCIVAFSFGVASAQTGESASEPDPVGVGTQQDVQLPPSEMEAQVSKSAAEMEAGAATVRRQLEQARAARDVVKVLCLNDKLNQIDVAIRSATDRTGSLRLALQRGDSDRARHEFTVVQVLADRVRDLVAEANQCIGEETGFVGESSITVQIDPNIPDDPTEWPPEFVISEPPLSSTPIQ